MPPKARCLSVAKSSMCISKKKETVQQSRKVSCTSVAKDKSISSMKQTVRQSQKVDCVSIGRGKMCISTTKQTVTKSLEIKAIPKSGQNAGRGQYLTDGQSKNRITDRAHGSSSARGRGGSTSQRRGSPSRGRGNGGNAQTVVVQNFYHFN